MYVVPLKALEMTIYPLQTVQVFGSNSMQVFALKQNKALIKISIKYSDFANIFFKKKA